MIGQGVEESQSLPYAFRERIVFFLHTHFTTKSSKANNSRALYFQDALFRMYAFDQEDRIILPMDETEEERIVIIDFRNLAKKVCLDNAMLRFLDGRLNVKDSPNENYAREFLELYTVGRGLETAGFDPPEFEGDYIFYTEQDVQQGALVLSGFDEDRTFTNIDADTGLPRGIIKGNMIANQHDNSRKVFSGRLGTGEVNPNAALLMSGQATEESAIDEIDQLVNLLFDQEETLLHVIRRLYRYFVYHNISEPLQETVIRELADTFITGGFKLYPVLRELLVSKHFYDAEAGAVDNNFGGIIKSPLDLVIGFVRTFNLQIPDPMNNLEGYYETLRQYRREISLMGMDLYDPFEVAGYPGYHQFPLYYRSWITPNYLTNRYNFIRNRVAIAAVPEPGQINTILWFLNNFPVSTLRNAQQLITELIRFLQPVSDNLSFEEDAVGGEVTPERLNFYLQEFLFKEGLGDTGEEAWDALWDIN